MSDSTIHIDKSCVFRETFNSSFDVYKNSGTISDAQINLGKVKFNGNNSNSKITYKHSSRGYYKLFSIVFRLNINKIAMGTLYDSRPYGGTVGVKIYDDNTINTFGNIYINGQLKNTYDLDTKFICITGIIGTKSSEYFHIGWNWGYGGSLFGEIESVEIYNRRLTANEVNLLYQKKIYSKSKIEPAKYEVICKNGYIEKTSNVIVTSSINIKKLNGIYGFFSLNTSINWDLSKPITICMWVYSIKSSINNEIILFNIGNAGNLIVGYTKTLFYTSIVGVGSISIPTTIKIGKWFFISTQYIPYSTNSRVKLFLNNQSASRIINGKVTGGITCIGRPAGQPSNTYFSYFKLYENKILNDNEILQIYNSEKQQFGI